MVHSRRAEGLKAWIGSLRICWMASLPLGSVWASLFAASSLAVGSAAPADDQSARDALALVQERRRHNNVGVPASGGVGSCGAIWQRRMRRRAGARWHADVTNDLGGRTAHPVLLSVRGAKRP